MNLGLRGDGPARNLESDTLWLSRFGRGIHGYGFDLCRRDAEGMKSDWLQGEVTFQGTLDCREVKF
jgi:hypothetical protein